TLIKPQFEAKKEEVGKKGIIRDPKIHEKVLLRVLDFIATSGYNIEELTFSPITGGEGNIEFIAHLSSKSPIKQSEINIKKLVTEANYNLIKNNLRSHYVSKLQRHIKIRVLITEKEIDTQDELVEQLKSSDFDVTQATVSRDIKELHLVKVPSNKGTYKYS